MFILSSVFRGLEFSSIVIEGHRKKLTIFLNCALKRNYEN